MLKRTTFLLAVILVAAWGPSSNLADDPAPTPAPQATVVVEPTSAQYALVGGQWKPAEKVRTIEATVRVDGTATSVRVEAARLVTVTVGGQTFEVVAADPVDVLELPTDAGRLYGLDVPAGKYLVTVLSVEAGNISVDRVRVEVRTPTPDPDDPDPPPQDVPFPAPGLAVMVVREASDQSLPPAQLSIFTSKTINSWLAANCVKDSKGDPFARTWDDDYTADQLGNVGDDVKAAYAATKAAAKSMPWICISNGKTGFSGPLPANVDAMLELLGRYK